MKFIDNIDFEDIFLEYIDDGKCIIINEYENYKDYYFDSKSNCKSVIEKIKNKYSFNLNYFVHDEQSLHWYSEEFVKLN